MSAPAEPTFLDALAMAEVATNRLAASLASADLNVNLLVLNAEDAIEPHANTEVDVLLVAMVGQGEVVIDDEPVALTPGQVVLIPKGANRAIRPIGGRFAYLTCHRRRAGLRPQPVPPRKPERA